MLWQYICAPVKLCTHWISTHTIHVNLKIYYSILKRRKEQLFSDVKYGATIEYLSIHTFQSLWFIKTNNENRQLWCFRIKNDYFMNCQQVSENGVKYGHLYLRLENAVQWEIFLILTSISKTLEYIFQK